MTKYFVLSILEDGPDNVEGREYYTNYAAAEKAAEKLCRYSPKRKYGIFKLEGSYWLDPKPKVLNDLPSSDKVD